MNAKPMRYLLFVLMLISAGCAGQTATKEEQIDTAKLFDPKQEPVDYGSTDMFNNFVLLNQHPFALTIQTKSFQINSYEELYKKIRDSKPAVEKSKFYIVVDSSFSFNQDVDIINHLRQIGITNYKLINFDSYFKPALVKSEPPVITKTTVDAIDSSFFTLTIFKNRFEIGFLNQSYVLTSGAQVDRFIKEHLTLIDPGKVVLIGSAEITYDQMKPILDIFKKYNYYRFRMVTR